MVNVGACCVGSVGSVGSIDGVGSASYDDAAHYWQVESRYLASVVPKSSILSLWKMLLTLAGCIVTMYEIGRYLQCKDL
jgi:hypothetical protein